MKWHLIILTYCLFCCCIFYCCNSEQLYSKKKSNPAEAKGLTLNHLLDSLNIKPIRVSDTDRRFIKEYKEIYDEFSINFNFPMLADGSWMLIGRAYGKPRYVVQVKNGKKHGYSIIADEKSGYVRAVSNYQEDKKNGLSISYSMQGIKDGIFVYSNDIIIDTAYLVYPNGLIQKKRIYQNNELVRIIDYDKQSQIITDNFQYKDSNVTYNYINRKIVSKIKHDYHLPREVIVIHFDSNESVFRIDTNRIK